MSGVWPVCGCGKLMSAPCAIALSTSATFSSFGSLHARCSKMLALSVSSPGAARAVAASNTATRRTRSCPVIASESCGLRTPAKMVFRGAILLVKTIHRTPAQPATSFRHGPSAGAIFRARAVRMIVKRCGYELGESLDSLGLSLPHTNAGHMMIATSTCRRKEHG